MKHRLIAAAMAAAFIATGCGDDDDPAGPGTTIEPGLVVVTMKGVLVGATFSGDIEITIGTGTTTAGVTGCLYLSQASCTALTGTYTVATKGITFTAASPSITFTGTYNGGEIHGSFSGAESGEFVLIDGSAVVFCGTFDGDANGTWNFVVEGNGLDGVYDDGTGPDDLSGTVNGNSFSITFSGGTASGTRNGSSASGTWVAAGNNGTWTGSSSGCRS